MKCPNVKQMNKNSTIVNVNNNCCFKCKKRSVHHKKRNSVKKISGRIFQLCNSGPKVYFISITSRPSALIQVENKSDCTMQAIIRINHKRKIVQTIEREQQVTIQVPSIQYLKIQCTGEHNHYCRGFYSLCLC